MVFNKIKLIVLYIVWQFFLLKMVYLFIDAKKNVLKM